MTRPDLLALTTDALTDLTNRGTVRRAQRELGGCGATVAADDDGRVVVRTDDGVVCELPAGAGPSAWVCSCAAPACCRHLVRAVLAVQRDLGGDASPGATDDAAADPGATEPGPADPAATDDVATGQGTPPEDDGAPAARGRTGAARLAAIGDDDLAAVCSPATLRWARGALVEGAVGHVGTLRGTDVVRLAHPVTATVRFPDGAPAYARCSCPEPDPCRHVPVAVAIARGRLHEPSGLHLVGEDAWRAPGGLLDAVDAALHDLLVVGVEAAHGRLDGGWVRLAARLRDAGLRHLADIADEVLEQVAHYGARRDAYDPAHLVLLLAELAARRASLGATHPGRVPDRVVAGTPVAVARQGRSTFVGLGTSTRRVDQRWRVTAHVVDVRTGAPGRLVRHAPVTDGAPRADLPAAGVPLATWGSGRVALDGLRIDGSGDLDVRRRRGVGSPAPDLTALPAPWLADDLAGLAACRDRVPPLLGDRGAGAGLHAVRFEAVADRGTAPDGALVARLVDRHGAVATLRGPGRAGAATRALLEPGSGPLVVSGRWSGPDAAPCVDPLLVVRDDAVVQPHLDADAAPPAGGADGVPGTGGLGDLLDGALGRAVLAGVDRLRTDTLWRRLALDADAVGAQSVSALASALDAGGDPRDLVRLLLVHGFARQGG